MAADDDSTEAGPQEGEGQPPPEGRPEPVARPAPPPPMRPEPGVPPAPPVSGDDEDAIEISVQNRHTGAPPPPMHPDAAGPTDAAWFEHGQRREGPGQPAPPPPRRSTATPAPPPPVPMRGDAGYGAPPPPASAPPPPASAPPPPFRYSEAPPPPMTEQHGAADCCPACGAHYPPLMRRLFGARGRHADGCAFTSLPLRHVAGLDTSQAQHLLGAQRPPQQDS